ncbi:uncharacterized protein [Phyllobates terribilis]|uniref:uncharacterized protein n=1 Tax=Phyllobates terribilis TaxID=111132 RepID=UPI003CCB5907
MIRKNCITIISTNYIAPEYANSTHLQNYRDHFKINMRNLQPKDSGLYQCGIGDDNSRFFYPINVKVSKGDKIPYSSEVIVTHLKGSIMINCPVPQEFNTRWKYLCKMSTIGVPSCHTMVNSSGYVHQNFWKRILIHEVSNTSDFKILVNKIKMNDYGFYRCGTGKFEDGSDWTDLHIHILNPSNKIRYQITKPLNRYPGEQVMTQCRVPISFKSVSLIYWCRWNNTGCLRLIDNDGFVQEGFQNRIFFNNTNRHITITLNHLELGDTGCYWCIITDGHNVETSSVEIYILATPTTELYLSSIIRKTHGNILTGTTANSIGITLHNVLFVLANSHINVTLSLSSTKNLPPTLIPNHTVLNTETSKSQTGDLTSTTSKNQVTGNRVEYISSLLPTTRDTALTQSIPNKQDSHINVTLSLSSTKNLPPTLIPNHTVLNTETSKSQTGDLTSTTSKNQVTGKREEYISSLLPTTRDSALTQSIPNKQDSHINVTLSLSSTKNLPPTLIPNHTVLNTETSKSQTGDLTSTTSKNQVTGKREEYISSLLPTTRDSALTQSIPNKQGDWLPEEIS